MEVTIKYLFCISTGRCGTDYLSSLLGTLNNCESYHEQKPLLHNAIMRTYLAGDKNLMDQHLPEKLHNIRTSIKNDKLYVDTSHMFIKGFGWELAKHLNPQHIGVIILKREKESVVQSTQRIHSGPYTYLGRKWILVPYQKAIIPPPISVLRYKITYAFFKIYSSLLGQKRSIKRKYPSFIKRSSIRLLRWYYDETYALGKLFQKEFPKIHYLEVNLEELNTLTGFEKIVNAFHLKDRYQSEKVMPLIGKKRNLKSKYRGS